MSAVDIWFIASMSGVIFISVGVILWFNTFGGQDEDEGM